MTVINVERAVNGARIRFGYDPELVELIKTIPSKQRRWDNSVKTWTIYNLRLLEEFLDSAREDGHIVNDDRPEPPEPPRSANKETWADELLKACGPQLAPKVFKQLSKALHPDMGGNLVLMQELNAANQRYSK